MSRRPVPAAEESSAARLASAVRTGWRAAVHPQRLYQRNVRRVCTGRVLDLGCGVGRHLAQLDPTSVGVDIDRAALSLARARGLTALTPDELARSGHLQPDAFDTLLCSHVLEHLDHDDALDLVATHLPFVRRGGRVVIICPQARGQRRDPTHVTYLPADRLVELLTRAGAVVDRVRSFPLPTVAGRWFTHNETVVVAHVPDRP